MIVSPVESSRWTRSVGSSSTIRPSAVLSLSTSLRVFGWIEAAYDVSGKTIRSSVTGSSRTVRVSPVEASSFGMTPMSPRPIRGVASWVLPRMNMIWVIRSSRDLAAFQTWLSPLQRAREDAHERHPPDVRVGDRLEGQRRELAVRLGGLLRAGRRRRQQRDDRVQDAVDRRSGGVAEVARTGIRLPSRTAVASDRLERLGRQVLAFEVQVDQLVVVLADRLDQRLAVQVDGVGRVGRARRTRSVRAALVRLAVQQVDDAAEAVLAADRDRQRHDLVAVPLAKLRPGPGRSPSSRGPAC